jgi:hypothetical protein
LYEEYEDKIQPPTETPQPKVIDKKQDTSKSQPADENFESKLKGIIGETDIEENNDKQHQSDNQAQQYEQSFRITSRRRK